MLLWHDADEVIVTHIQYLVKQMFDPLAYGLKPRICLTVNFTVLSIANIKSCLVKIHSLHSPYVWKHRHACLQTCALWVYFVQILWTGFGAGRITGHSYLLCFPYIWIVLHFYLLIPSTFLSLIFGTFNKYVSTRNFVCVSCISANTRAPWLLVQQWLVISLVHWVGRYFLMVHRHTFNKETVYVWFDWKTWPDFGFDRKGYLDINRIMFLYLWCAVLCCALSYLAGWWIYFDCCFSSLFLPWRLLQF